LVQVGYNGDPVGTASQNLVRHVRDVTPPEGSTVLVGGQTATLVDQLDSIRHTLPWMGLVMVVSMLVLLFLAFGSFVLPIKAVLVNILSLGAAFGAITWIFQDGHLASWLGFQPLSYLEASNPILMLAVVFGLSMDYEVFLLSRIREEWDATHDNTRSVALGLQRSGRIITSAALLLLIVIGAFSTSQIVTLKMIGIGMIVALAVDATIVRALLVPATMRLLGYANWWAPTPLLRWWNRHGFREGGSLPRAEERVYEPAPR
jgi:RND superfamily putative drug exporter